METSEWEHGRWRGRRDASAASAAALTQVVGHLETLPFGSNEFGLKRRRFQEVGRVQLAGLDLAVKRWRILPGLADPAARAARHERMLEMAGVPTPLLVACLRAGSRAAHGADAMLLTRWLAGTRPLNLCCAGHRPYQRRLRPVLGEIAALCARMHEGGVGHRDLRPENLLAREDDQGRLGDLHLIDLDEVDSIDAGDLRRAARDLAGLVFQLRRIEVPDHSSLRILVYYARRRALSRRAMRRLVSRTMRLASLRAGWRRARRSWGWLPRLRAPKAQANTPELVHRVYGAEAPR